MFNNTISTPFCLYNKNKTFMCLMKWRLFYQTTIIFNNSTQCFSILVWDMAVSKKSFQEILSTDLIFKTAIIKTHGNAWQTKNRSRSTNECHDWTTLSLLEINTNMEMSFYHKDCLYSLHTPVVFQSQQGFKMSSVLKVYNLKMSYFMVV